MASQDVESGFEALLKPLQDITSKVWDIVLTKALEKYLAQINNGSTAFVNFTEAAVLVQNSASFYCKRVDSVHLGCRQFAEKLMDTYNTVFGTNRIMDVLIHDNLDSRKDKENGETDGQAVKKKRTPKNYANADFEVMDLFFSDSNIDVNLTTIDKYAENKKTILNKYPKANRKVNTSCPVYQSKGAVMGLKEDFRLNWFVSSDGVLNEDIITIGKSPSLVDWCVLPEDTLQVARHSMDNQFENSCHMDIDPMSSNLLGLNVSSPPRGPSPDLHDSPIRNPSPLLVTDMPLQKRSIQDPFKELSFNFVPPPNAFLKKQHFSLPKTLIEEIKAWKVRRIENKEKATNPNYTFSCFFDFMKHRSVLHSPSAELVKLNKNAKMRQKEILTRHKFYEKASAKAAQEYNDDFQGFDANEVGEDCIDGIELDRVDEMAIINIPEIQAEATVDYNHDKEEIMAAYEENKRRYAAEQTEVARRVQAWHESLADALEVAESRAQFDIHQYGTMILDKFDQPPEMKPVIPFEQVVQDVPRHEISRYLLSSLMLANTYNVEIVQEESVKDSFHLRLLSTVRHHEEMDDNLPLQH